MLLENERVITNKLHVVKYSVHSFVPPSTQFPNKCLTVIIRAWPMKLFLTGVTEKYFWVISRNNFLHRTIIRVIKRVSRKLNISVDKIGLIRRGN